MKQQRLDIRADLDIGHGIGAESGAATGPIPVEA
jgi:hypothetical protein